MPIIRALQSNLHLVGPSLTKYSVVKMGAAVVAASAVEMEEQRLGVMFIILLVSLFAVSFPTLSKQTRYLRIPGIVFFIGKHFGTGVILATAFIHLLDDAFRSLADPKIEERYGNLSKWTGSIILVSLLAIFLVEYISTSFVEHLNERSSAPPTPISSQRPSRRPSPAPSRTALPPPAAQPISETTPLLRVSPITQPEDMRSSSLPPRPLTRPHTFHAPQPHALHTHQVQLPLLPGFSMEVLTNSPRICRLALAHEPKTLKKVEDEEQCVCDDADVVSSEVEHAHAEDSETQRPRIGRRRQVVGLLVLQLGIMIHSFVIGLTLSVTSGSDFTSLTTAIVFHQLFEGLSLGIRIASLPPDRRHTHHSKHLDVEQVDERLEEDAHSPRRASSPSPQRVRAPPREALALPPHTTHAHSPVNGTHKPHQRFPSGSSSPLPVKAKGRQSPSPSPWRRRWRLVKGIQWLKPTLTVLFGVTTPLGMALGLILWSGPGKQRTVSDVSMLLIQGIMSAVSAGLLIYAATVEMIAGDFVFGDVEGHHHHHHHAHEEGEGQSQAEPHTHDHPHHPLHTKGPQRTRPTLSGPSVGEPSAVEGAAAELGMQEAAAGEEPLEREVVAAAEEGEGEAKGEGEGEGERRGTPVGKRVLAVLSLFAGAGMMVLVGLGEGD
ncbi:hypothetical protein CVT26_003329 [Gymnopilus dilepis]|uniref:Zinc/iron permease n=1 Tax=Gymnopilus dilepis TaxID=231916 RepID=A0A409W2R2_9AGAR|nr:hypothetical protein CVT26_003329 [Gymnopilus dilepis]